MGNKAIVRSIKDLFECSNQIRPIMLEGMTGCGKCVLGTSYIVSEDGISQIKDYSSNIKGFSNLSLLLKSKNDTSKSEFFFEEEVDCYYLIKNSLGIGLGGTPEHKIFILNKNLDFEFKELSKLKTGDYCCIDRNILDLRIEDSKIDYKEIIKEKDYSSTLLRNIPRKINKDIAKLLGYIIANGSCYKNANGSILYQFSSKNPGIKSDLSKIIKELGCNTDNFHNKKDFQIGGVSLGKFLNYLCDCDKLPTARFKKIPRVILKSSLGIHISFLRGLFDCDSSLCKSTLEYSTASAILAEQVQLMLLNLGIVSTKIPKYLKKYDHTYWRILIYGKEIDNYLNIIGSLKYTSYKIFKRNTNKDIIPYLKDWILKRVAEIRTELKVKKSGHYLSDNKMYRFDLCNTDIYNKVSNMTYETLVKFYLHIKNSKIEDPILLNKIKEIIHSNYYFSKIVDIQQINEKTVVYDFNIPSNHTFVTNGYISHNTTIAHIIARKFGAMDENINDYNCVKYSKVDDMREELDRLNRTSIFGNKKVLILDEIHRLGEPNYKAQEVLLKPLEIENLSNNILYIACTTISIKVKPALLERFIRFRVSPLSDTECMELVSRACTGENLDIPKWVKSLLIEKSEGIPRRLLTGLAKVRGLTEFDMDEITFMLDLNAIEEDADILNLFKFIIRKDANWSVVKSTLSKLLRSKSPEAVRVGMMNLIGGRLISSYCGGTIEQIALIKSYKELKKLDGYPEKANTIIGVCDMVLNLKEG